MSSRDFASKQLPLDLPVISAGGREDLLVSPSNARAVDLIDHWPNWPGNVAILAGPVGSGKTHLAGIWAETSQAILIDRQGLKSAELHLHSPVNVVIEDLGQIENSATSADAIAEDALFHLINHVKSNSKYLLITTRTWPSTWGLTLADLNSRLRAAHLVEIGEPDEDLLRQVLVKLFSDRQLNIDLPLVDYCLTRMERSLGSARELVARLDREALSVGKPINRSIARKVLVEMAQSTLQFEDSE